MGLDMYAFATPSKPETETDFRIPKDGITTELAYWRKHPDLHGWMETLYRKKGGTEDDFNVVNLLLTPEDIDTLDEAVRNDFLPPTQGFFFGQSDGSEKDHDMAFIAKAREAHAAGLTVYYTSWW